MPTLGEVLGAAKRSAAGIERCLQAVDPKLAQAASQAAEEAGVSVSGYGRIAVAEFSRFANEDNWAQLTRILRDSDDPGAACLVFMVRWSLARQDAGLKEEQKEKQKDELNEEALL